MKAHNDLVLYKRHLSGCTIAKGRAKPAKQKFMFDCPCPFWIMGRMASGDAVPRQSTGTADQKEAERKCAELRARNAQTNAKPGVHGPTLEDCISRYVTDHSEEVGEETTDYITLYLTRLKEYCAKKGILYTKELTIDVVLNFRADTMQLLKGTTKRMNMSVVRSFLRDAFRRGWVTEALAEKMPKYKVVFDQKQPFESEEVKRLIAGSEEPRRGRHPYHRHPQTFRLLLELMLTTGMRVSDALEYNPALVRKGAALWRYKFEPKKQRRTSLKKQVTVYLPEDLKEAIDRCHWTSQQLPFYAGARSRHTAYDTMKKIGTKQNINDCRPHRLRDTFAVQKLLDGMLLEDVSRLLGHSSVKITEQYYAAWTTGRQDLLESRVSQSMTTTVQKPPDGTFRD